MNKIYLYDNKFWAYEKYFLKFVVVATTYRVNKELRIHHTQGYFPPHPIGKAILKKKYRELNTLQEFEENVLKPNKK